MRVYMSSKVKGHIFAVLTICIWSSTFIVSKIILETLMPIQVLFIRYGLALAFLSLIYPKFKKPTSLKEEATFLFIGGVLVCYFIFENSALQRTYSSNVSLIVATIPILTGLMSMAIYKTGFFNVKNLIGLLLAYGGVAVIIMNGSRLEGVAPVGDFLAFGAAIMFAVYTLAMEQPKDVYHIIQRTRKVFAYGFLVLLMVVLFKGTGFSGIVITKPLVASMFYLGIVASSLAFIMWNDAIKRLGPIRTNLYIYLVPVVTTFMSALVLKEKVTWLTLVGAVGILAGLYLSEQDEVADNRKTESMMSLDDNL